MSWRRLPIPAAGAVLAGLLIAGCGQPPQPGDGDQRADGRPSAQTQPPGSSSAGAPGEPGSGSNPAEIGPEEAGRIATDEFGGEVIDIESDTAKGAPSWEVEIRDSKEGRIEVDVSKSTGKIVEKEVD